MQQVDAGGRKRHRYFVLTPTYLAIFAGEEHAAITEEGFLLGLTDADSEIPEGEPTGVQVALADVDKIGSGGEGGDVVLTVALKEGKTVPGPDGSTPVGVITAECANADIASGWAGAITAQWEGHASVEVPKRVPKAQQPQPAPPQPAPAPAAAAAAPSSSSSSASSSSSLSRSGSGRGLLASAASVGGLMGSMRSLLGKPGPEEPVRQDSEYVAYEPWAGKGVDMTAKASKKHWKDKAGNDAVLLHGWLTKRNKSGLTAGMKSGEKERYFVLTPTSLAFFADDKIAALSPDGGTYMHGKAEGSRTGSLFGKTGARLPLESVMEVRLLGPNGKPVREAPGAAARAKAEAEAAKKGGAAKGGKKKAIDSDDEDSDDDGKKKAAAAKKEAAAASSSGDTLGATGSVLFQIDFADSVLTCNAHNERCRAAWVAALRKWAGIRKVAVDEELFDIGSVERRKEAEGYGSD